jgi:hypothetical protein
MATSPQTSANQYLIRAREQSRWSRRASVPPASSEPTLPVLADSQEHTVWEELREGEVSKPVRDADLWRPGSALIEAKCLYEMIGKNGDDAQTLRELISVSDADRRELGLWIEQEPYLRNKIQAMIHFREMVLAAFDRLAGNALSAAGR